MGGESEEQRRQERDDEAARMGDIVDTKAKAPRTDRSACILETRASTTNEMSQRRGVTARDPGWGHPDDVLLYFQRFQSYC